MCPWTENKACTRRPVQQQTTPTANNVSSECQPHYRHVSSKCRVRTLSSPTTWVSNLPGSIMVLRAPTHRPAQACGRQLGAIAELTSPLQKLLLPNAEAANKAQAVAGGNELNRHTWKRWSDTRASMPARATRQRRQGRQAAPTRWTCKRDRDCWLRVSLRCLRGVSAADGGSLNSSPGADWI